MTAKPSNSLEGLRERIEAVDGELLRLISERARLASEIQRVKTRDGVPTHLPQREKELLDELVRQNPGPLSGSQVRRLFRKILETSVELMRSEQERTLAVSRAAHPADTQIRIGELIIGDQPVIIAGPCSVEDELQMDEVAAALRAMGLRLMRGGAYKPRTSPYSFQGHGLAGLQMLRAAATRHGLYVVTEVTDTRNVELVSQYADVLQIGSRNMYNYDLLREVGQSRRPVLLKRGICATLEELLCSAEYILNAGNTEVMLCERGIRSYEHETRNTLDISAVPLLRQKSHLPVIVDVSHAAGRKDILPALGRAALAAGANGVMVEVHPRPHLARSDSQQQLDFAEFRRFHAALGLGTEQQRPTLLGGDRRPGPLAAEHG